MNAAGILRPDPIKAHPDDSACSESSEDSPIDRASSPASSRLAENLVKGLFSAEWSDWQDSMGLNVSALYYTSVGFAPFLNASYLANPSTETNPRESPSIINIGSIAGFHNAVNISFAQENSLATKAEMLRRLSFTARRRTRLVPSLQSSRDPPHEGPRNPIPPPSHPRQRHRSWVSQLPPATNCLIAEGVVLQSLPYRNDQHRPSCDPRDSQDPLQSDA